MFYSQISKKPTESEYRFKTKEEFEEEYGVKWRSELIYMWIVDMDYLFGENVIKEFIINDYGVFNDNNCYSDPYMAYKNENRINTNRYWYMSKNMTTKNDKLVEYNKPRQLVYESKVMDYYNPITKNTTINEYRFKTMDEISEEYGENWRDGEHYWRNYMDYLLGSDLEKSIITIDYGVFHDGLSDDSYDTYLIYDDKFKIDKDMITKNDIRIEYNKPRQLVYESKILKFNNYNK